MCFKSIISEIHNRMVLKNIEIAPNVGYENFKSH